MLHSPVQSFYGAHNCNSNSRVWNGSCRAKHLLLRSIRPNPNTRTQNLLRRSDLCPHICIYCDIWKLAALVYSRQPSPSMSPISPQQQRLYSRSPISPTDYENERTVKTIESAYTQQRAQLNSIISICTARGAEESEGLRIAHDRCLGTVLELLRQERVLQRQQQQQAREYEQWQQQQREWERERDCGYGARQANQSRSGSRSGSASVVSCAT